MALTDQLGASIVPPMSRSVTILADVTAFSFVLASWAQVLPALAAGLAAVWYAVQIWESKTVRAIRLRVYTRFYPEDNDHDLFI